MKRFLVGIALVLCLVFLFGCGSSQKALTIPLAKEPVTLDPQIAQGEDALLVLSTLYEGLTRQTPEGDVVPGVADTWQVSDDGKTYRFSLREDAKWNDGTQVVAEDFVFAWQRALNPATNSSTCNALFVLANGEAVHNGTMPLSALGVRAVNHHTLEVQLGHSSEDFLALCATAPFYPCQEAFFQGTNGQYGLTAETVLCNGSMTMAHRYAWEHGEFVNLKANPEYWNRQQAQAESLLFSIGEKGSFSAVADGTFSGSFVSAAQAQQAVEQGYPVSSVTNTTIGLCFNTKDAALKASATRQSLCHVLQQGKLDSSLPAEAEVATSLFPPSVAEGEAAATVPTANGKVQAITLLVPDTQEGKALGDGILSLWNTAFHQYFLMEPVSEATLQARVKQGDYQAALLPLTGTRAVDFLLPFTSQSQNNGSQFANSTYDRLVQTATTTENPALYTQAANLLTEQGAFLPLYYKTTYFMAEKTSPWLRLLPDGAGLSLLT